VVPVYSLHVIRYSFHAKIWKGGNGQMVSLSRPEPDRSISHLTVVGKRESVRR